MIKCTCCDATLSFDRCRIAIKCSSKVPGSGSIYLDANGLVDLIQEAKAALMAMTKSEVTDAGGRDNEY